MAGHRHRSRRGPVRRMTGGRARRLTVARDPMEVVQPVLPVQLAVDGEAEVAAAVEPHAVDTNLRLLFAADRKHRFRPAY